MPHTPVFHRDVDLENRAYKHGMSEASVKRHRIIDLRRILDDDDDDVRPDVDSDEHTQECAGPNTSKSDTDPCVRGSTQQALVHETNSGCNPCDRQLWHLKTLYDDTSKTATKALQYIRTHGAALQRRNVSPDFARTMRVHIQSKYNVVRACIMTYMSIKRSLEDMLRVEKLIFPMSADIADVAVTVGEANHRRIIRINMFLTLVEKTVALVD